MPKATIWSVTSAAVCAVDKAWTCKLPSTAIASVRRATIWVVSSAVRCVMLRLATWLVPKDAI